MWTDIDYMDAVSYREEGRVERKERDFYPGALNVVVPLASALGLV